MKLIFIIIFILASQISFSQNDPSIKVLSSLTIAGTAPMGTEVILDYGADGIIDHIINIDDSEKFSYNFPNPLPINTDVQIWSKYLSDNRDVRFKRIIKETGRITYKVKDDSSIVRDMIEGIVNESIESIALKKLDASNYELKNTTLIYKSTISNTYFQLPIARFNYVSDNDKIKKGNVSLFTSIGAGVGLSWGRMEITRDNRGQIMNEDFSNTFGFHLGVLFASGTGDDSKNVFAPTFNISVLDFQIGLGYEMGTIAINQKRVFSTLSYAIPVYKLVRKSYRVWRINDLPYDSIKGASI